MISKNATGSVLFSSVVAAFFALSFLSLAHDSVASPQWCTKAKTKVEKLICDEGQLGEFDRESAAYYAALLKMVAPSARPDLVQSQKEWIAEREKCGATAKNAEDLLSCVDRKIHQRSEALYKDIQKRNAEERLSEFNKFKLETFKNAEFEFQYPQFWLLDTTQAGEISLKSDPEEMILGYEKTVTSSNKCTYSGEGLSEDDIRRFFYAGKKRIGGREFTSFYRSFIPSGEERHYYGFFNGRCFAIHVSDNSQAASNCGRIDDGEDRADCEIAELEAKDLMAYSDAVIRTLRFLK